jgi:hypothetical protein
MAAAEASAVEVILRALITEAAAETPSATTAELAAVVVDNTRPDCLLSFYLVALGAYVAEVLGRPSNTA